MKCPVCLSTSWKSLFLAKDRLYHISGAFRVVTCKKCGLWKFDPHLGEKDVRQYYPETYYSYKDSVRPSIFWRLRTFVIARSASSNIFDRLIRFFIKIPAIPSYVQRGKILDVGCGSGESLMQLKLVGWDVYGIDIDRFAIQIAHKRGLLNVKFGSYQSLQSYADGTFDVIRVYHVIEHLDNPDLFLKLAYQKLKIGGELIIGTPNNESILAKIARTYWLNLDCPRHRYIFSVKTLNRLLAKRKFVIKKQEFFSVGGIVGTIQYYCNEKFGLKYHLVGNPFFILLFYPLERLLDWCRLGDVFITHAMKENL